MTIAAVATAAKCIALVAEVRRCLAIGVPLQGQNLRDVLDQLENSTTTDTTARTDILGDTIQDGRSTAEAALAA